MRKSHRIDRDSPGLLRIEILEFPYWTRFYTTAPWRIVGPTPPFNDYCRAYPKRILLGGAVATGRVGGYRISPPTKLELPAE